MRFCDIHSHLSFPYFDDNRAEVLARMRENNVATVTVGVDLESSKQAVSFAEANEDVYATIGLHPNDNKEESFEPHAFEPLASSPKVVAIGECGLDYYREGKQSERERQRKSFEAQIAFAIKHDKPLMIHARPSQGTMDAYEEALEILSIYRKDSSNLRGNFHFFVGDTTIAQEVFTIGFTVSFSGVITFAKEYEEVVRYAPLKMIHAETDAPYATPVPHRGKQNEPVFVIDIVRNIAHIKGISVEEASHVLTENANRLFGIS